MEWINKIDRIICLNLNKRTDRLLDFAKQADEYNIPFERYTAIEDEQGARGLRDSMINIFNEQIERKAQHTLIFEDDAEIKVGKDEFHLWMNKAIEQLPENYWQLLLGCQLTSNGCTFHSPNLIRGTKMFATHAVIYSLQGMKEIMARNFDYPIDNFYVSELQQYGNIYCTYPLLVSQRPSYSDIGKNEIDWRPFIDQRFEQQVANIRR